MDNILKPPIFLLGNVRSGTSMMLRLFDQHPDVVGWYEPRTVWVYADPSRPHDRFDQTDATQSVKRYIRSRFLAYQRRHGNCRVMEKTPSNIFRIPYVRAIFPESRFVYMIREPLANLSSAELKWRVPISLRHTIERLLEVPKSQLHYYSGQFIKHNFHSRILRRKHVNVWGVRYPGIYEDLKTMTVEQVIAKQWVACARQAEQDLDQIPPELVLHIRYEDFVADPVPQFKRILRHFDLQLTKRLQHVLRTEVDPGRQDKWKRLDPRVLQQCIPILADEMAKHGYRLPQQVLPQAEYSAGDAAR